MVAVQLDNEPENLRIGEDLYDQSAKQAAAEQTAENDENKAVGRDELGQMESGQAAKNATDKEGFYRDESQGGTAGNKKEPLPRLNQFLRKHKGGFALGGVVGSGGIGFLVFITVSLSGLELLGIVAQLETVFGAGTAIATELTGEKLLNHWIAKDILPNLSKGICKTSASPACVTDEGGKGPIARMFRSLKEGHLETTLYKGSGTLDNPTGLVFGRRGQDLYMAYGGQDIAGPEELAQVMRGEKTIFTVGTRSRISPETLQKARQAIKDSFKDESLYWRTWHRYQLGKLIERKYGVIRCVLVCKITDPIKVAVQDAKLAARTFMWTRVILPGSSRYGTIMACILNGTAECSDALEKVKDSGAFNQGEPSVGMESNFSTDLEQTFFRYAQQGAEYETLNNAIYEASKVVGKNQSIRDYVIVTILSRFIGEEAAKSLAKAIPIIGWVLLIASVIAALDVGNQLLQHFVYLTNSTMSVHLFDMYQTVSSEYMSGHANIGEVQSFEQTLHTNMDDTSTDVSDATTTPLYGALNGGSPKDTSYKCNDGKPVPKGQLVCTEEKLDRGSDMLQAAHDIVNVIPVITALSHILNAINNLIGVVFGGAFQAACNFYDRIPPQFNSCTNAINQAAQWGSQLSSWFMDKLVPTPFSDHMSGGRTYDMMAAGADVEANSGCKLALGCGRLTNQQVADQRNEYLAEEKTSFEAQPLFARLFATDSPYSLVSRLAMVAPSNVPMAMSNLASVVGNPFSAISGTFSTVFTGPKAFAAQQPFDDPFGVIQYGYTPDQIPADPVDYWNQNCEGKNFTETWNNSMTMDKNTGEPVPAHPEPCLLIQSMAQASGGFFDPSLIPDDQKNSSQ